MKNSPTPVRRFAATFVFAVTLFTGVVAKADDGYRLWLRYEPLPAGYAKRVDAQVAELVVPGDSATAAAIRAEMQRATLGMLGHPVHLEKTVDHDGAVVVGTPKNCPPIADLKLEEQLSPLGPDGFLIRSVKIGTHQTTVIAANTDVGSLYGAFHFLRLLQTLQVLNFLDLTQTPSFQLRVLNHWDNLDGSIERGYAGKSLWNWGELPGKVDPRLTDYARANASIGINGSVLNNVNSSAQSLTHDYLVKTAAIADVFRSYGIKVYLSARFSAPIEIGGLKTADPLDPEVAAWWKAKADEIYQLIPDFGGWVVKANSEGQPGPLTYKRTHADGANMMASAVAPHGGVVMWRAFVYAAKPDSDRVGQAYDALQPFDGQFASNVLLQVKNGPLDFQPREPFHPLFGAMPKTQLMPELEITQEYLGQARQVAFLAPLWLEFLDSRTDADRPDSTVANVVTNVVTSGPAEHKLTGIAGVANTGTDRNWTGHDLAQANWYAFGRLAWNCHLSSPKIAEEWSQMTFTTDTKTVQFLSRLLLRSREAVVDYSMPLGLTHIMRGSNHYGPEPDRAVSKDFHRADTVGLGYDRTLTGSNAAGQYLSATHKRFADLATCPDELLLWFHHVPWDYRMRSGRTMWDELCLHYQHGVDWTHTAREDWDALSATIDPERHAAVAAKLAIQERDAMEWRDVCLPYFQTFSKRPFPAGVDVSQAAAKGSPVESVPATVFKNLQAGKKQTVIVYGTSLSINGAWAKAVQEYFDRLYPNQVTFINSAKGGMASNWGVENLGTRVLNNHPDLVFLEFAVNDASKNNHTSLEKSAANLDAMVKALRAQNPQVDIILQTMNTAWDSPNQAEHKKYASDRPDLLDYYAGYRKYAGDNHLPLVDNTPNWQKLQQGDPEKFHAWLPEGLHPVPEASLAVTWPAVESLLEKGRLAAGGK